LAVFAPKDNSFILLAIFDCEGVVLVLLEADEGRDRGRGSMRG
jgi:hypothetical protein